MCNKWDYTKVCCSNCKYYKRDWSTDAAWCDLEGDDGEWVKQESEAYWSPNNDYCTNYEECKEWEGEL